MYTILTTCSYWSMLNPNEIVDCSMHDETRWPCHPPLFADHYKHLDVAEIVKLTDLWVVIGGSKTGIFTDGWVECTLCLCPTVTDSRVAAFESIRQKEDGIVTYASTWWKAVAIWNAHCRSEHQHILVCSNRTQISSPTEQTNLPSCYYVLCYNGEWKIMSSW